MGGTGISGHCRDSDLRITDSRGANQDSDQAGYRPSLQGMDSHASLQPVTQPGTERLQATSTSPWHRGAMVLSSLRVLASARHQHSSVPRGMSGGGSCSGDWLRGGGKASVGVMPKERTRRLMTLGTQQAGKGDCLDGGGAPGLPEQRSRLRATRLCRENRC